MKIRLFFTSGWLLFVAGIYASCHFPFSPGSGEKPTIRIGTKQFTESYILGEILARALEAEHYPVERRFGLGGTMVCWRALESGQIDLYPEYTGTLKRAIFKKEARDSDEVLPALLEKEGLLMLDPFGFENAYALGIKKSIATRYHLRSISDLSGIPGLRFGMNHEFMKRSDGWEAMAAIYGIRAHPVIMHHALLYDAIREDRADIINVFTTDGEIDRFGLVILEDDQNFFPHYLAAPLVRDDLDPEITRILNRFAGKLSNERMRKLNLLGQNAGYEKAAEQLLREEGIAGQTGEADRGRGLLRLTLEHLGLTFFSVLGAVLAAIPFSLLMRRFPPLASPVLYLTGLLQTIPSIALLAFMIPLLGIGVIPAMTALFLYALLPVLRNIYTALRSLDPFLLKTADSLGMTRKQKLFLVEIPLALPGVLAGIRTATVINTGTATLAAFIGAGGLGEPIVSGLSLNDPVLILKGAIPAALLAIGFELFFEAVEYIWIPAHLRKEKRH